MVRRILHVVGGMNRGGVETWLMHVLRHIDRDRFKMDFLVHTTEPCAYDDEIRSLGARIIPCPYPQQPWQYARSFRRVLREYGPYDVVHSHVHHFSGFVMRIAAHHDVPCRIAHSHTDTRLIEESASISRQVYLAAMSRWMQRYTTLGLAISGAAAESMFPSGWQADPRYRILYYGIDLGPFQHSVDKRSLRAEFGIPANAFVIGHVGRFVDVKNHGFVVRVARELFQMLPDAYLLLVGDGPTRQQTEILVQELGIAERVVFAGMRSDVADVMIGGMDAFIFPSLYEGFGLVALEAQAAGIPVVMATTVPHEVAAIPELCTRLSLDDLIPHWVEKIVAIRRCDSRLGREVVIDRLTDSPFNIDNAIETLTSYYESSK